MRFWLSTMCLGEVIDNNYGISRLEKLKAPRWRSMTVLSNLAYNDRFQSYRYLPDLWGVVLLAFAAAVLLLLITPGPGVLSAAGVGAGYGFKSGSRYIGGLWFGNLMVGLIVISGLWAVLITIPGLRLGLGIASLCYLAYLALRIATAGSSIRFARASGAPGFVAGTLLQFINPKAYAVNSFLFTNFAFYPESLAFEVVTKILILNAIWIPIHFTWLQVGIVLHRLELGPSRQRMVNFAMAASLMLVVLIAARELMGW